MTSTSLPLTNMEGGLTIVTKVVPSLTVPAATEQNLSQTQSQLQNFLKGEPKALGVSSYYNLLYHAMHGGNA